MLIAKGIVDRLEGDRAVIIFENREVLALFNNDKNLQPGQALELQLAGSLDRDDLAKNILNEILAEK